MMTSDNRSLKVIHNTSLRKSIQNMISNKVNTHSIINTITHLNKVSSLTIMANQQ